PIRQKSVPTRRKFTPFDASKPFCIPFKLPTTINDNNSSGIQIIDKDQEICSNMETNSTFEIPQILLENCKNCNIDIKFTFQKKISILL
ncbi:26924_t:CDS:1, partial [Dentiscutata erythropus]